MKDTTPEPIRLDRFMAEANAAYYATHDPYADFTTAPEITQAFGEVLGAWSAVMWEGMGRPDPVLLTEAGPGRGTLMADALRAIGQVTPDLHRALRLHLIETSPRLRTGQAARLTGATWHDNIGGLPEGPLLLLANEFLDALPVRQFVRRGSGWTERHVQDGRMVERPTDGPSTSDPRRDAPEGSVLETCAPGLELARALGVRLARERGAALFLDYGAERSAPGESLQALRDGRPADPFEAPGEADLTAHVDFQAFAAAARAGGAVVHGPLPQGVFLTRLGLFQRTDRLARGLPPVAALALIEAARRLVEPDRMGRLFKAMAVCHPDAPIPPGFEP